MTNGWRSIGEKSAVRIGSKARRNEMQGGDLAGGGRERGGVESSKV